MEKNVKIYRYSRGDKYSCKVSIINNDTVMFSNIKYPDGTPETIVERLLNDAERKALELHTKTKYIKRG